MFPNSSVQILHSNFASNKANESGGAVFLEQVLSAVFFNSSFSSNTARRGGALCSVNTNIRPVQTSTISVEKCFFERNKANISGGAAYLNNTEATFEHSDLVHNIAPVGGAVLVEGILASLHLSSFKFMRNNEGVFVRSLQCLSAKNTIFLQNSLIIVNSEAEIENCSFELNAAFREGGAIYLGEFSKLLVVNSTIRANKASKGGGISLRDSKLFLQESLIQDNSAEIGGGGLSAFGINTGLSFRFYNSSFIENRAVTGAVFAIRMDSSSGNTVDLYTLKTLIKYNNTVLNYTKEFREKMTPQLFYVVRPDIVEQTNQFASGKNIPFSAGHTVFTRFQVCTLFSLCSVFSVSSGML